LELFPFATGEGAAPAAAAASSARQTSEDLSIKRQTRQLEKRLIAAALRRTQGNRTRAARILEISPRALQYKIKEYEIEPLNRASAAADSG
jgi:two-component system response regulator AtoC